MEELLKNSNLAFALLPRILQCLPNEVLKSCREVHGHVSFSSPPFHPSMQHPKFYTLSISSMILHFYHFLTCLIIPWISSCTISNSISQNVISSQPFHPHLKCLPFHPCIFHPRMTRIGWKRRVEYANMKLLG